MRVFITGSAGFIGFHLARRLLAEGHVVIGYDGMTSYYDPALKQRRLEQLSGAVGFSQIVGMLEDKGRLEGALAESAADIVIHLAAQAGVRYSLEHPEIYVQSNLVGTFNLLEAARALKPRHLLLASTSSVYGGNRAVPYAESAVADWPVSLYAATKKANEAMSHAYAHLHDIPTTCFRFFTVYGPWGRPDMALFRFAAAIRRGEPIEVYGEGRMQRDFTYIDDLVEAIHRLMHVPPVSGHPIAAEGVTDSLSPVAPWRVVNIAGGRAVGLLAFIEALEAAIGRTAEKRMLPMQPGDMVETWADPGLLKALTGYVPATDIRAGLAAFVAWHQASEVERTGR